MTPRRQASKRAKGRTPAGSAPTPPDRHTRYSARHARAARSLRTRRDDDCYARRARARSGGEGCCRGAPTSFVLANRIVQRAAAPALLRGRRTGRGVLPRGSQCAPSTKVFNLCHEQMETQGELVKSWDIPLQVHLEKISAPSTNHLGRKPPPICKQTPAGTALPPAPRPVSGVATPMAGRRRTRQGPPVRTPTGWAR